MRHTNPYGLAAIATTCALLALYMVAQVNAAPTALTRARRDANCPAVHGDQVTAVNCLACSVDEIPVPCHSLLIFGRIGKMGTYDALKRFGTDPFTIKLLRSANGAVLTNSSSSTSSNMTATSPVVYGKVISDSLTIMEVVFGTAKSSEQLLLTRNDTLQVELKPGMFGLYRFDPILDEQRYNQSVDANATASLSGIDTNTIIIIGVAIGAALLCLLIGLFVVKIIVKTQRLNQQLDHPTPSPTASKRRAHGKSSSRGQARGGHQKRSPPSHLRSGHVSESGSLTELMKKRAKEQKVARPDTKEPTKLDRGATSRGDSAMHGQKPSHTTPNVVQHKAQKTQRRSGSGSRSSYPQSLRAMLLQHHNLESCTDEVDIFVSDSEDDGSIVSLTMPDSPKQQQKRTLQSDDVQQHPQVQDAVIDFTAPESAKQSPRQDQRSMHRAAKKNSPLQKYQQVHQHQVQHALHYGFEDLSSQQPANLDISYAMDEPVQEEFKPVLSSDSGSVYSNSSAAPQQRMGERGAVRSFPQPQPHPQQQRSTGLTAKQSADPPFQHEQKQRQEQVQRKDSGILTAAALAGYPTLPLPTRLPARRENRKQTRRTLEQYTQLDPLFSIEEQSIVSSSSTT
eukprot:m.3234 g.3234  ORF g.3234 m.3234 type:complete len:623 (-) comp3886_c0_seq1:111-1979(-)